jgi:TolA-binding protein
MTRNNPATTIARRGWKAGLCGLLLLAGALAGCDSFASSDVALLSRDVYEIKGNLDKAIAKHDAADRQTKYALDEIQNDLQGRNDAIKTSMEDMEKRLRDQGAALQKLQDQLQLVNFAVGAMTKRTGEAGGDLTTAGGQAGAAPGPAQGGEPNATNPLNLNPANVDQLLTSGQQQYNAQNYQGARDVLRQALQNGPKPDEHAEILYWLGESNLKLNAQDDAKKCFTDLIGAHPSHVKAWFSLEELANIALAQGQKDLALKMLQQITQNNPTYAQIGRVKATIARIQQPPSVTPPKP